MKFQIFLMAQFGHNILDVPIASSSDDIAVNVDVFASRSLEQLFKRRCYLVLFSHDLKDCQGKLVLVLKTPV